MCRCDVVWFDCGLLVCVLLCVWMCVVYVGAYVGVSWRRRGVESWFKLVGFVLLNVF